jgi:glycosyltransferase involved in cell wall biosynthesis
MEIIFVDPEPPDLAGGGIRTYLRLALKACHDYGIATQVYTHNPQAYPDSTVRSIGRTTCLPRPWRWLAYHFQYSQNVLWEQSKWLANELESLDTPDKIYEFADFFGYGFFVLRKPAMRERTVIRVHTPDFLVPGKLKGFLNMLAKWQGAWREKFVLSQARHLTVPSAEFIQEMLPNLKAWKHIPNPLPIEAKSIPIPEETIPERFLYLGRIEPRKGVLPLVRAFLKLVLDRPNATLTLVGGAVPGPYSASVRTLIDAQTPEIRLRIKWDPPCPENLRSALFSQFQVIVVPSLWENSPYVYFEGMTEGLVCLGSATGEMKAVARVTGGPTALPGNEDDLLRALRKVSSHSSKPILVAQYDYLRKRKTEIPKQLTDFYLSLVRP